MNITKSKCTKNYLTYKEEGKMKKILVLLVLLTMVLAACGPTAETPVVEEPAAEEPAVEEPAAAGVTELKILWAEWDPANFLQEIGNMYEAETGIKVNVVQEPWGSFYDLTAAQWAARSDTYDMVVGDSQWVGQGVVQGHYVNLTDFFVERGINESVTVATLKFYGEYPHGSGSYWAYPTEGDAVGWAYRKDLFEDPTMMADFEAEYGYPLDIPETYEQLMDIAKFFTRPDDPVNGVGYGVGIYTQKDYDGMIMGYENVKFSWGADWYDPETFEVEGVVNSPQAVEALEFYRELYDCCAPPGTSNAFFAEMNDAYISGQAAMIMNYFAFFPALANPGINPFADVTGYFTGPEGPYGDRYVALGGQGLSVHSYISPERQQASLDFIEWFAQEDIQMEWALLGGYTCNINVLESQEFLDVAPFNAAFAESMGIVKDFWNIPVFGQMLEPINRIMHAFLVDGQGTAQEALDQIAVEHRQILVDEGILD
jgi:multiple sugar transport system substrate-binding protein